jgi:hypothetical protein
MISNLLLLFLVIAKVTLFTGLGPGIAIAILFETFGVGAVRPQQSESGHVRGSNPRFVSDSFSANSISSGGGQLVQKKPGTLHRTTSPPRKVRLA